jgi:hypothetical protein
LGRFTVDRHGNSRYFAVSENGLLVCVAVYLKGALAVASRLQAQEFGIPMAADRPQA